MLISGYAAVRHECDLLKMHRKHLHKNVGNLLITAWHTGAKLSIRCPEFLCGQALDLYAKTTDCRYEDLHRNIVLSRPTIYVQ